MLSVIIETRDDGEALARTLGSLVPAAVEGTVREVIVCDVSAGETARQVAEHAGCEFLSGSLTGAIRRARAEWLLFLEPGTRLAEGWTDAVRDHLAHRTGPARFTRSRKSRLSRLALLLRLVSRGSQLIDGLVIEKARALALAEGGNAERLARKVSARRLRGEIHLPA